MRDEASCDETIARFIAKSKSRLVVSYFPAAI